MSFKRGIVFILISVGCFVASYLLTNDNVSAELIGMGIGFLIAVFIEFGAWLIAQRKFLGLWWDCYKYFWGKSPIRLSIAYLYRIEVNGKYLLIKSHRFNDRYQPIGGVYKYFEPEGKTDLLMLGAVTDSGIDNDEDSEGDLRIKLSDRRTLFQFIKWFRKGKHREIDPWREFYEELVRPGHLSANNFSYMQYEIIGQDFSKRLKLSPHFKIDEFMYADIYRVKCMNLQQETELRELVKRECEDFIWATGDEILQGRTKKGNYVIAEHTKKIFKTDFL
ncbi:MAG: hypothetical protein IPG01_13150 [Chitinophagaceae bacterium]|nr:hypothetical protein [Chitinophagaceae bacterium]